MGHQYILESHAESPKSVAHAGSGPVRDRAAGPAILDKVFALAVLVGFAPLLAILALAIMIGGRHPIFFQERIGYKGRSFWIYKFRTMPDEGWVEAARRAQAGPIARFQLAVFTQVSAILRNTGLDELPQFANILKGDMQVIGPRPLMKCDFMALPERRMERCSVLPGITGFAQINGGQDLDSDSKLALDLYLIAHSSRSIAAKIVLRTVLRILGFSSATAKASETDLARARDHMNAQRRVLTTVPAVRATRDRQPHSDARPSFAAKGPHVSSDQRPRVTRLVSLPVLFGKPLTEKPSDLEGISGTASRGSH